MDVSQTFSSTDLNFPYPVYWGVEDKSSFHVAEILKIFIRTLYDIIFKSMKLKESDPHLP